MATTIRSIQASWRSVPTTEGAGVRLRRAFGFQHVPQFDPFLLFDDFHSEHPADYLAGFPWHPHRGIETVTYMLHGVVKHGDSMGNHGVIEGGDVQWMTAGSGIIHEEMPQQSDSGLLWGVQLWVNLPASQKMMPPRYRDVRGATIPEVALDNGVRVKVVCGRVGGVNAPVADIVVDPEYLDVTIPPHVTFIHPVKDGYTAFTYILDGSGHFIGTAPPTPFEKEMLTLFERTGDNIHIDGGNNGARLLLISGKPIGEPVAWHGPIVMNTKQELQTAFQEYQDGTFIK